MGLYQYISFPDGTEISCSEILTDENNQKSVRVYVEQWNDDIRDFNALEIYLPEGNVTKLSGFSKKVADEHIKHIMNLKTTIWEIASERNRL